MRPPLYLTLGLFAVTTPCYGQSTKASDPKFNITLDDVSGQRNYQHPLRPQLHYTPLQGHVGDATILEQDDLYCGLGPVPPGVLVDDPEPYWWQRKP